MSGQSGSVSHRVGVDLSGQSGPGDLLPQLHGPGDAIHGHGHHVHHTASRLRQQTQQSPAHAAEKALHAASSTA